jgi:hypothetical protein
VRPQLGDLGHLDITAHTVRGRIRLVADKAGGLHHVAITLPAGCPGELLLPAGTAAGLPPLGQDQQLGLSIFRLDPGQTHHFSLPTA